jgi:hypothetical protein
MELTMRKLLVAFAALLVLATDPVLSADPVVGDGDPPGRVGRLSHIEGPVSILPEGQDPWEPALVNYPITSGSALRAEQGGRAEIQIEDAAVRLDSNSDVLLTRLDDEAVRVRLQQGAINVRLMGSAVETLTIEATNGGEAVLLGAGRYHLETTPTNGAVNVVVLEGNARLTDPRGSLTLRKGEGAVLGGAGEGFAMLTAKQTPFDDWALTRDGISPASQTALYVSPQTTGYQDLDRAGTWQSAPEYGTIWYPTAVPVGWAPYRYGRWVYVRPWGWTWIDDARWGFAPFHYGRWVYIGNRWGWWPGRRYHRPVYSPALVAFVGFSSGASRPAVGWVPLAPYEVYRPHYRVSNTYIRNVNVTTVNQTTINNITVNNVQAASVSSFRNRSAATAVSEQSFRNARSVQNATFTVPQDQAQQRNADDMQRIRPERRGRDSDRDGDRDRNGPRQQDRSPQPSANLAAPSTQPQQQQQDGVNRVRPGEGARGDRSQDGRSQDRRTPEQRGQDTRTPEQRGQDTRTPEQRGQDVRTPEQRGQDTRRPEQRGQDPRFQNRRDTDSRRANPAPGQNPAPQTQQPRAQQPQAQQPQAQPEQQRRPAVRPDFNRQEFDRRQAERESQRREAVQRDQAQRDVQRANAEREAQQRQQAVQRDNERREAARRDFERRSAEQRQQVEQQRRQQEQARQQSFQRQQQQQGSFARPQGSAPRPQGSSENRRSPEAQQQRQEQRERRRADDDNRRRNPQQQQQTN